ncbi:hypothetical protein ACFLZ6_01820, partial [Nanoarchaeota archaeon]
GGAVPGKEIRVVEVPEVDVEACGGTHLKNTQEAEEIKIIKSSKIQDGIVRLTFTSGKAAEKEEAKEEGIIGEIAKLLGVEVSQVPGRAQELFDKWKNARKAVKKGKKMDVKELELVSKEKYDGDVLAKTADLLRTQPEVIDKTISRFLKELEEAKEKLK